MNKSWNRTTLGECAIINTDTYSPKEGWPFINYLETGQITDNSISDIHHLTVGVDKIPASARRKIRSGDIVYSTVRPNKDHYGMIKNLPDNFLVSTAFAVIRGKPYLADTSYIYYYITQKSVIEFFHTLAEHSSSAYPSLQMKDLEILEIVLPPIETQQTIAHILETLDDKIELNRRMNDNLEEMARALFRSWFVDFDPVRAKMDGHWKHGQSLPGLPAELYDIFPDRLVPSELGKTPEGWQIAPIQETCTIVGGTTPSTKEITFWEGGHHFWATPKDLSALDTPVLMRTNRKITDQGLARISSGLLPIGTVLISSRAPIGYLAVAEVPVAINQGFIAMLPNHEISNLFLLYWCEYFKSEIMNRASGTTFLEINKRNFRQIMMTIPDPSLMSWFDNIVRPLYNRIKINEEENNILINIRDTLLPKLLSGEIRVDELDIPL